MKILINALSVTNASGRYVLGGHLRRLRLQAKDRHRLVLLHGPENRDLLGELGKAAEAFEAPAVTRNWPVRRAYERAMLSRIAHRFGADAVFTPAGTATPGLEIPQVVFAQNPWSLVSGLVRTPAQRLKAGLQRRAYREAMKTARVMVFNSRYMRRAYRKNAGRRERESVIVYQGIDDKTRRAAEAARNEITRKRFQVLCVSAMASHKNAETLVEAVALVRDRHLVPATIVFVGAWPDAAYAARIRGMVQRRGLGGRVTFAGHVSKAELHRRYAESRLFCLLSRCESFGIPAVEAQTFGTPVVGGNCCAVPEVCGKGGVYPPPVDAAAAARCLAHLITDDDRWRWFSDAARRNANRFRWSDCSRPLLEVFHRLEGNNRR